MVGRQTVGWNCGQSRFAGDARPPPTSQDVSMLIGLIPPPWLPVPPPAYGGTESVIDRLARGLVEVGHEVLLAAAANSTCPVDRVAGTDQAADGAPAIGGAVPELRHVVTSYAAMADVDVIHDHTMCGPVYRHHPADVAVVTTNHGPFDAVLNPIYRALRRVPVIAISRSQASTADGVDIAAVIYHGIDVEVVPERTGKDDMRRDPLSSAHRKCVSCCGA